MFVICMICRSDKPGVQSDKYGDQWGVLPCHHVIHAHCFNKWCDTIKKESSDDQPMFSCPACRTDLGSKPVVFKCHLSTLDGESEIFELEALLQNFETTFANRKLDAKRGKKRVNAPVNSDNGEPQIIAECESPSTTKIKIEEDEHDELTELREENVKLRNELKTVTEALRKQQAPAKIIAHFAKRIMEEAKGK